MRLLNRSRTPKYSSLAKCHVPAGKSTRELDVFSVAVQSVFGQAKGFDIILSDSDIRILAELCAKYLAPKVRDDPGALRGLAGADALAQTLRDPDGTKVLAERAIEVRKAIQGIRDKTRAEAAEKEARIRAESNIIGPDGNPVPRVDSVVQDKYKDVKPELHKEMTTDLKSVIENNLAVMRTASGQPFTDDKAVVAPPGGTRVSSNPKDYQKPRTVPAGQPEMPGRKNA